MLMESSRVLSHCSQQTLDEPVVSLEKVSHVYGHGAGSYVALKAVTLAIAGGQSCAIVGPSGSGKSTLLNLIGLLDQPSSGRLLLAGREMARASAQERAMMRNRTLGFVFQGFNLLPRLSALDNVALPLLYRGLSQRRAQEAAQAQLCSVGLGNRGRQRPADLSGGQRQRVAIARALVTQPRLLLADEPTGNLDGQTAADIVELLLALNREQGVTLVVVTHDEHIAGRMARRIQVCNGQVIEFAYG